MENAVRYSQARFMTLLGGAKNAFLALLKIAFGITGNSHALFADGIHSLSDLLIDGMVLIASRFGSKEADHDHPYGHGRIETAITVVLAFVLAFAGLGIVIDAGYEIYGTRMPVQPSLYVMAVALLSVLLNEILYVYTKRTGERIHSKLLITNAWHHRSDSASSLVVLIGVGCAWFGLKTFDALAAVIVGVMIIKMAWTFGWNSVRELVDTGLDDETVAQIRDVIIAVPGVVEAHQLRTRSVGGLIFLDLHILVDPTISVSEGHYIGHQVHCRVQNEIPGVADVIVHVDPEDDEQSAPSQNLPTRLEITALLKACWQTILTHDIIENVKLHYLAGKIFIELVLSADIFPFSEREHLLARLKAAVADKPEIAMIKIYYQ